MDALYTSPLLRARQTAAILGGTLRVARLSTSSRLLEVRTAYQGSPNAILVPGFSFYEPRKSEGDETMNDVLGRMLKFMRMAIQRHAGGAVVVVSHADPIAILRLGLEGKPLTASELHAVVYPERASVNQIVLEPGRPAQLTYFDVSRRAAQAV